MDEMINDEKKENKPSIRYIMDQFFCISKHNTSIKTEIIAGFTTFMTIAYIIIVNPLILSTVGMDYKAVFVATCLAAAV